MSLPCLACHAIDARECFDKERLPDDTDVGLEACICECHQVTTIDEDEETHDLGGES